MATSQFTFYSSSDPNGPGPINGLTGSLLTILDACLVNGYPGKPAAGWDKPLPNLSGSLGCYRNISGSAMTLFVNDAGWLLAGGKEAVIVGWEYLVGMTSSVALPYPLSITGSHGSGYGQFPSQVLQPPFGHVLWRKSATADATQRSWFMYADQYTMYLFISSGDAPAVSQGNGVYHTCIFGDIFSLKGVSDVGRCSIYGCRFDNSGYWWVATTWNDMFDVIPGSNGSSIPQQYAFTVLSPSHFMARTAGGMPGAIQVCKYGDTSHTYEWARSHFYSSSTFYLTGWDFAGGLPCPNGTDQSIYMAPVMIGESNAHIRGRLRGVFHFKHLSSNFTDGQIIQGSGDYAGKTFQVVRYCGPLNNAFAFEISPTVETNS